MIWNSIRKADRDTKTKIYDKLKDFYSELSKEQMEYMLMKISNSEISSLIKEELEFATRTCSAIHRDEKIAASEKSRIISSALDIFWKAMCEPSELNVEISKIASNS